MGDSSFSADGVPVRIFHPTNLSSEAGIIFIHGGGWMHGSVEEYASDTQNLSNLTGLKLFSIEYRKPPQYIYPVPFEDCLAATQYIMNHAKDYDINSRNVILAGDDSGGNLALAVTLKLRDIHFHHVLKMVVLLYPCLQIFDFSLPSYSLPEYPGLDKHTMVYYWLMYGYGKTDFQGYLMRNTHITREARETYNKLMDLDNMPDYYIEKDYKRPDTPHGNEELWNTMKELVLDPYFAPGMAADLTNLPITYVLTAGKDPLRDEGIIFAHRLYATDSNVKHDHYPSLNHGELFGRPSLLKYAVQFIKFAEPNEYSDSDSN